MLLGAWGGVFALVPGVIGTSLFIYRLHQRKSVLATGSIERAALSKFLAEYLSTVAVLVSTSVLACGFWPGRGPAFWVASASSVIWIVCLVVRVRSVLLRYAADHQAVA